MNLPAARAVGHFLHPQNDDARALCYRAVALSIRDVLVASLTGKDPREAPHYLAPLYYDDAGARWASLRLVPKSPAGQQELEARRPRR